LPRQPGSARRMSAGYGTYGGRSYGPAEGHGYPADQLRPSSEHSILRSGGGPRPRPAKSRVNIWELIFVPWMFLALILICYLLAGANGETAAMWIVPVVMIGMCVAFIKWHYRLGNNAEVVLGLLCTTAVLIGLVVGVYAAVKSLSEFRRLSMGASYFNVLASEPAAGRMDGTTFMFENGTGVDQSRAFGYTDIYSSSATMYCVAPVSPLSGDRLSKISFWVAGTNCCESRGSFSCGEATTAGASGALVQPQAMQDSEGFRLAITGAESAYNLQPSESRLLVAWSSDPIAYRDSLWSTTVTLFLIFGGVYLLISVMIGFSLMPVIMLK